jgi:hypothetical protein
MTAKSCEATEESLDTLYREWPGHTDQSPCSRRSEVKQGKVCWCRGTLKLSLIFNYEVSYLDFRTMEFTS